MGLGGEGTTHRYPSIHSVRNMVEHLAYLLINIRNEVQNASNQRLADADLQSTPPSMIDISKFYTFSFPSSMATPFGAACLVLPYLSTSFMLYACTEE